MPGENRPQTPACCVAVKTSAHPSLATLVTLFVAGAVPVATAADASPKRLRRAESFLGIHFDFHAGEDCREIGRNTTPAMIERIIDLVHPDYLQIDSKGHPGFTSYPTKVGNPAPGFVGDPLRVWRDVTARRGVALYVHHSGLYDSHAVLKPGWAAIGADGKPSSQATSVFGPYADQLLIPQLREIAGTYGVDGVWVDGECWSAVVDYGPTAIEAFRKATGLADAPRKRGEAHWLEWQDFHRQAFRNYLRHYVGEVRRTNPEFQLCSNWAFTDHMAEPVSIPMDFLSGDYSPEDSVNSARLSGRFLVRQGTPWDLMAWSFSINPEHRQKTAVQLQREAAVVVALGGGFQAYHTQKRDGSIRDEQMPVMAEVAKFCRDRQELCHHAMPVPQVGLLLSTPGHYRRIHGLFNRDLAHVQGVLEALLEGQQAVDVVNEAQLAGRLAEYPVLVVPEWDYLDPAFRNDLTAYVEQGGSLLLLGPGPTALFEAELGVKLQGKRQSAAAVRLARGETALPLRGDWQRLEPGPETRPFGRIQPGEGDQSSGGSAAAVIRKLGRGRIAATCFDLGKGYHSGPTAGIRDFLNELVAELFPEPLVRVTGSQDVDVCVMRQRGRLQVNLINTAGPHRTKPILDAIPAVGPLTVSVRVDAKPSRVALAPSGAVLDFEYREGRVVARVPKVDVHEIMVLTP